MRLWYLIFVLLSAFVSQSARASVCSKFSVPLTQASFSGLASQVKDQFPTQVRTRLDQVGLVVLQTGADQLYASEGRDGFEIAVSETYLATTCTIALWAVATRGADTEAGVLLEDLQRRICARAPDRRACALQQMDVAVRAFEEADANKKIITDIQPIMTQVVFSTFRFALAHEFGHVVQDRTRRSGQNLDDPETAADLFALAIYASGRNWPSSDTILFAGRRFYDAVADDRSAMDGPHQEGQCRALRSNQFRTAVTAPLTAINQWRASQDMEMNLSVLALSGDSLKVSVPQAGGGCVDDNAASRLEVFSDLARLQAWTGAWPKAADLQLAAIKQLGGLRLSSQFGEVVRAGMIASYSSSSTMETARMVVDSSLTRSTATQHQLRTAAFNERQFGKYLSAKDLQNVRIADALSQFLTKLGPGGPVKAAELLTKSLTKVEPLADPGATFLVTASVSDLLLGRCQEGMAKMISVLTKFQNPLAEVGAFSVLSGQDAAGVRATNDEFAKLLAGAPTEISSEQRQKCLANSEKLRLNLARALAGN